VVISVTVLYCAIVAATALFTAQYYRGLPDRVPIHFGISGQADGYGPRQLIWLLVAFQLVFAIVYSVVYAKGRDPHLLVVGLGSMLILAWAQVQAVRAAASDTQRIPPLPLWGGFSVILTAMFVGMYLTR
jgi:hypothetical protein